MTLYFSAAHKKTLDCWVETYGGSYSSILAWLVETYPKAVESMLRRRNRNIVEAERLEARAKKLRRR